MAARAGGAAQEAQALAVAGLTKAFGETRALAHVGLEVRWGEVHGLMGANGSGKSTLIKALAGVVPADSGTIAVRGTVHDAAAMTPAAARAAGLRFVHQSSTTLPDLTVAENLALGHGFPRGLGGRIRWSALHQRAREVLARFAIDVDSRRPMRDLSPAVQTTVAIARALQDVDDDASGILVLDEPTAALPRAEVAHLLAAIRRYADAGQAIVLVDHRIDEALSVCDRVSVLREGHHVATRPAGELDERRLIELMMDRPLDRLFPEQGDAPAGDVAVELAHVAGGPLVDATVAVRAGEIVGIAGLLGSGRTELLETAFGLRDPGPAGRVALFGRDVRLTGPGHAMELGVAYLPEDRPGAAAFLDLSVGENLSAAMLSRYWTRLRMDRRRERADARDLIAAYAIKAPGAGSRMSTLSGGNQQKVVFARWLERGPRLLLLDEPTQGVDIGARADLYRFIRSAAGEGCAIVVVSSDFEELVHVCDRIAVLADGRVSRSVAAADVTSHDLAELVYADMEIAR